MALMLKTIYKNATDEIGKLVVKPGSDRTVLPEKSTLGCQHQLCRKSRILTDHKLALTLLWEASCPLQRPVLIPEPVNVRFESISHHNVRSVWVCVAMIGKLTELPLSKLTQLTFLGRLRSLPRNLRETVAAGHVFSTPALAFCRCKCRNTALKKPHQRKGSLLAALL